MRRQTAGGIASQDGADSKRTPDVTALGAMSWVRGWIRVAHCHLTDQAGRIDAARQWKLNKLSVALLPRVIFIRNAVYVDGSRND